MRLTARTGPALSGSDYAPIQAGDFEHWMERLGPFETAPRIAVAVSGGRDSIALALLAKEWARARGGDIHAITIDHGLRPNATQEAARVGRWMSAHDIPHQIVQWETPEHNSGIEAAARLARYALLEAYCRRHAILHLLVGHHQADQMETHQMRLARGSGPAGLAGMPAIREMAHTRVLRPLLDVPRDRITATLNVMGQDWVEDPSNQDERFARARMRARGGAAVAVRDVRRAATQRTAHARRVSALAALAVSVDRAGFATLDLQAMRNADARVSRDLFGSVVTCVSGGVYPPRGSRLETLWARLVAGGIDRAWTLGGCIIRPAGVGQILVVREPAAVRAQKLPMADGTYWDGRFVVSAAGFAGTGLTVQAWGGAEANHAEHADSEALLRLPKEVRATLPALFCKNEVVALPSFDPARGALRSLYVRFAPQKPVSGAAFGNV